MFGRATIRLGIGPHSSCLLIDYSGNACYASVYVSSASDASQQLCCHLSTFTVNHEVRLSIIPLQVFFAHSFDVIRHCMSTTGACKIVECELGVQAVQSRVQRRSHGDTSVRRGCMQCREAV